MRIEHNVLLKEYTTFKMGGFCSDFYIPESREELQNLCNGIKPPFFLLGGGSNIVINDNKTFEKVIYLKEFDKQIRQVNGGHFYVGASVSLQKLILRINGLGYGGIEYLFSVPGTVGGAIVMNAGRGREHNSTIGNYVHSVYTLRNGEIISLSKEDCLFSHRCSCFLDSNDVVLGADFVFDKIPEKESEKLRKERIELCKATQDMTFPNFGTVFCSANMRIMKMVSLLESPHSKIGYSKKTANWMLNRGGSFLDVQKKLKLVLLIHKLLGKKCKQEVILWR